MKVIVTMVLFLLAGGLCCADSELGGVSDLYDKMMKVEFKPFSPLLVEWNGKQYRFGPFENNQDLVQDLVSDPKAEASFQISDSYQRGYAVMSVSTLALELSGLGIGIYALRMESDVSEWNAYHWTSIGLLGGAVVLSFVSQALLNTAQENFYKGVNQYNHDLLSGQLH